MLAEIYCDQCKGYNTVEIPESINGMHVITCGKCSHEHYRCINSGNITDKRYEKEFLERLKMKIFHYQGNWKEKAWEKNPFLSELWKRLAMSGGEV